MTKYKIRISIDRENFFWIIVENNNIINRNASRKELVEITTRVYNYNKTNICSRCREKNNITDKSILRPKNANREIDINGNETGRWVCNRCKAKNYNDLPDSHKNILKLVRSCRTGNDNPNHTIAKADLTQELTVRWRSTVSTIPVEDLNKKLGHNTPIDHSRDSELGIIQTQGRILRNISSYTTVKGDIRHYKGYGFTFIRDHNKEFDHMICYCIDKDNNIEETYIFPKKEIETMTGTTVLKDHLKNIWQEKYRVKNEETNKKINEIWKQILKEKGLIK